LAGFFVFGWDRRGVYHRFRSTEKADVMPERTTAIIPASALPPEIRAKLGDHPFPGARYRVTVEPAEAKDDDKLAALRDHLRSALAQADGGDLLDEDDVFADLQKKYPDPDA